MATETVRRMGQINFIGNIIPHTWYQFLRRETTDEETREMKQGKPHTTAIILLSEIAYWYRPRIVRDEQTGQVIRIEKRFAADLLQRTYMSFANQFGFTKRQVRDALKYLEEKKIITLELRTVTTKTDLVLNNVLFIDLDADALARITTPDQPDIPENVSPITKECNTYDAPSHTCTEIPTEITSEETQTQQSTVAPAVPDDTIPFSDLPIQEIDMAEEETSSQDAQKKPLKLPQPPAVRAFRTAAHRFPAKSWWAEIDKTVGTDEKALAKWQQIIHDWVGSGWNPVNIKGMLEAYHKGGIKPRAAPADDSMKGWVCWDN